MKKLSDYNGVHVIADQWKDPSLTEKDHFPTMENIACELQLHALGDWYPLKFELKESEWKQNEKAVEQFYRPFQPCANQTNDRDCILLYGMEGCDPTAPVGLSQVAEVLGRKPYETEFCHPTIAKDELTVFDEFFEYFNHDFGRSWILKLNAGGFFPIHRDHMLLNRNTVRLIAFMEDSRNQMEWIVDGIKREWMPNRIYYVNTMKLHRLNSWNHNSKMVVFNVPKTWENVIKIADMAHK